MSEPTTPLSDEELEKWRFIISDTQEWYNALDLPTREQALNVAGIFLNNLAPTLLAEVDRLRALELAATHAQVDEVMADKYAAWYEASRPIVAAVANVPTMNGSAILLIEGEGSIVEQARALLAKDLGDD